MSVSTYVSSVDAPAQSSPQLPTQQRALHRIGLVRRQQGVPLRTVARVLGTTIEEARWQEQETTDLPLSLLHGWHQALEVPITELLVESDDALAPPVLDRANLIRAMKTAVTLQQKAENAGIKRLAENLVSQLIEVMPELANVGPWQDAFGPRRTRDDLGKIAERPLSGRLSRQLEGDEAA